MYNLVLLIPAEIFGEKNRLPAVYAQFRNTASQRRCEFSNFFPAFSYAEPFELHRNLISFRANINSYANFSLKSASCKKGSFVSCLGCCQLPIRIIVCDHYLQETKYSS